MTKIEEILLSYKLTPESSYLDDIQAFDVIDMMKQYAEHYAKSVLQIAAENSKLKIRNEGTGNINIFDSFKLESFDIITDFDSIADIKLPEHDKIESDESDRNILNKFKVTELIDNLFEREVRREILESYLDKYAIDDIIEILKVQYRVENILEELDKDDIVEYLKDEYFIADDEKKAMELLEEGGYLDIPFSANKNVLNFRKNDCIEIIQKITDKDGWNNIYDMLMAEKDKLNII